MKTYPNIVELDDYLGVANSLGDFFHPDIARNSVVVRKGLLADGDNVMYNAIMAAYVPNPENVNLFVCDFSNDNDWRTLICICDESFEKLILDKYHPSYVK